MPSKTPKQARFMQAVAHSPSFARKVGVPQSVGEDFNSADERKRKPAQHKKRVKMMGRIARKAEARYG